MLYTNKNPHPLQNYSRDTGALPVDQGDTIATRRHRCKPEVLRETAVNTPIAHIGLPPTVIENATATETATGTGTGIGTVIAMGETRLVAAGDTTSPTRTTTADTPLLHVATLEIRTGTDPVATVMAHAIENAPRDIKTTITATDLPLVDTDRPARGITAMMATKIRKSVGDVDTRGGIAKRIGIAIGRDTTTCQIDPRAPTTNRWRVRIATREATLEESSTTLQVYMRANTGLGMTPTRCPFRIIL